MATEEEAAQSTVRPKVLRLPKDGTREKPEVIQTTPVKHPGSLRRLRGFHGSFPVRLEAIAGKFGSGFLFLSR